MELKSDEELQREKMQAHQKMAVNSIGFDEDVPDDKFEKPQPKSIKDRLKQRKQSETASEL